MCWGCFDGWDDGYMHTHTHRLDSAEQWPHSIPRCHTPPRSSFHAWENLFLFVLLFSVLGCILLIRLIAASMSNNQCTRMTNPDWNKVMTQKMFPQQYFLFIYFCSLILFHGKCENMLYVFSYTVIHCASCPASCHPCLISPDNGAFYEWHTEFGVVHMVRFGVNIVKVTTLNNLNCTAIIRPPLAFSYCWERFACSCFIVIPRKSH